MDKDIAKAVEAKTLLENARSEALEENAKHLLDRTLPFQVALDSIVQELDAAGVSKTKISAALGESRSTIYARVERKNGEGLKVKVAPTNAKVPTKFKTFGSPRYTLVDEGSSVLVKYDKFGPLGLSGTTEFMLIVEDDASMWLLYDGGTVENDDDDTSIMDELNSRFDGFYYDDFKKWTETELNNE